jgi:CDK-activating kinase assembly factor MAT1
VVAKSKAAATKRSSAAQKLTLQPSSSARLLRTRAQASHVVPDVPHVPFEDNVYSYADKYTLKPTYHDTASELVRADKEGVMRAGGYRVEEAWERAIRTAVAGLEIAPLVGASNTSLSLGSSPAATSA